MRNRAFGAAFLIAAALDLCAPAWELTFQKPGTQRGSVQKLGHHALWNPPAIEQVMEQPWLRDWKRRYQSAPPMGLNLEEATKQAAAGYFVRIDYGRTGIELAALFAAFLGAVFLSRLIVDRRSGL